MSKQHNHAPAYRIKTVASMTGLSTHLIRKWEERYDLLHPQRGPNGYRTFQEDDIQFLLYLKSLLTNGGTIGGLAQIGASHLRQTMRDISYNCSSLPHPFQSEGLKIINSAQGQNHEAIQRTIANWIQQLGIEDAMETVLFPLLRLIGDLWHQGMISLSAENSVSRIVRLQLINALGKYPSRDKNQALVACLPGDCHEIAPLTVTLLLQKYGWHATYLGTNVSFDVLQIALRRRQPELMILSSTTEPDIPTGQSWIESITKLSHPPCRVIVGGPGFRAFSDLLAKKGITYLQQVKQVSALDPQFSLLSRIATCQ